MTRAEREMVLYLIYDGGPDCCRKCIHLNKETCCLYVTPTDYSGKMDDNHCIKGMVNFFKRQRRERKRKKTQ